MPEEPTSEQVMDAFIDLVISRHGVPRAISSDRGSPLVSELCRTCYDMLGIDLRPSTAYHPMSQGVLERYNRTLNSLLRATGNDGADWV